MNKRSSKRITRRLPVTIIHKSRRHKTYTGNISAGGILVKTMRIFPHNTEVSVELILPSGEVITRRGRVTWSFAVPMQGYSKNGMGIEFTDRSQKYMDFIKSVHAETGDACPGEERSCLRKVKIVKLTMNEISFLGREQLIPDSHYRIGLSSHHTVNILGTKVISSVLKGTIREKGQVSSLYETNLEFLRMDNTGKEFLRKQIHARIDGEAKKVIHL